MKSLFDTEAYSEIENRLGQLSENSERQWGTMDAAQMLAHCQKPFEIALGKMTMKRPNLVMRIIFKRMKPMLYNDNLWKPNIPTGQEFKITDARDFSKEKENLSKIAAEFHGERNRSSWAPHPGFGKFTNEQWGQMQYKHLDHHFRQFGV